MVGTAKTYPGARDLLAGQILLDLAGEQGAAGSEYELGVALVGEAQNFRDVDVAGQDERDPVGQVAVKGRQRLLQGGVDGLAVRPEAPHRPVGEEPTAGRRRSEGRRVGQGGEA